MKINLVLKICNAFTKNISNSYDEHTLSLWVMGVYHIFRFILSIDNFPWIGKLWKQIISSSQLRGWVSKMHVPQMYNEDAVASYSCKMSDDRLKY